jgi:hypothetical protein
MKKLFLALTLTAAFLWAQGGPVVGQKTVQISPVTWTTGANTGKTRLMFRVGTVSLDTSTTGQAGAWKRIDNTADSCSQPFTLASDTNGSLRPVWEYRLWQLTRSRDGDSSTHVYRVQTRERVYNATINAIAWTPWSVKGANSGYADVTVQDSILVGNVKHTGAKYSQYSFFFVAGTQARLCPDDIAGTATTNTDSIFVDSLRVYVR